MKKALISPNESPVKHITGWDQYTPIYSDYPNSYRVAEVCDSEFEVATPLFWVDCADDIVEDQFYYNTVNQTIVPVVNEPRPAAQNQPNTSGTQTL
jgi:hypothetical protein